MNYTFKGKDYPKQIKLHHPEVETILSKDPLDITFREMNYLYDLPLESLTEDENNLILRELGRQQGKTLDKLAVDKIVTPLYYPKHTRMIDKNICGDLDVNLSIIQDNTPADMNYVETQPYPLMFLPLHYLWPNDDTKDFIF